MASVAIVNVGKVAAGERGGRVSTSRQHTTNNGSAAAIIVNAADSYLVIVLEEDCCGWIAVGVGCLAIVAAGGQASVDVRWRLFHFL